MMLVLYGSSYATCPRKAALALYEKGVDFELRELGLADLLWHERPALRDWFERVAARGPFERILLEDQHPMREKFRDGGTRVRPLAKRILDSIRT